MCYPRWNALPIVWIITLKITIPGFFGITVIDRIDNPFRLLQREACMKCIFFCFRWYNHQGGLDRLQDVLHSRRYRRHCYVQRGGGHISQRRFILWRDMPPHQCEVHTLHTLLINRGSRELARNGTLRGQGCDDTIGFTPGSFPDFIGELIQPSAFPALPPVLNSVPTTFICRQTSLPLSLLQRRPFHNVIFRVSTEVHHCEVTNQKSMHTM